MLNRLQINQTEFLKNRRDPLRSCVMHRVQLKAPPLKSKVSPRGPNCAGDNIDESGLPGAIFTEQYVHFAALQLKVDRVERDNARINFGDAAHRQERLLGQGRCVRSAALQIIPRQNPGLRCINWNHRRRPVNIAKPFEPKNMISFALFFVANNRREDLFAGLLNMG